MANEKKTKIEATEAVENTVNTSNTVEQTRFKPQEFSGIVLLPDVAVKRRGYDDKGKTRYEYFAVGNWCGKELEIYLTAGQFRPGTSNRTVFKDRDTYDLLDSFFELFNKLHLGVKVVEFDGRKTVSFFVVGVSENGVFSPIEMSINRPASKSKLVMLINELEAKYDISLPQIM